MQGLLRECAMKRFALIIFLVLGSVFLVQCEKASSVYKFEVISANAPCIGFYILDGDDRVPFDVDTTMEGSTYYYDYVKDLDSPTSILIHVDTISTNIANSITVYIYENDKIVKSQVFDSGSDINGNNNPISGEVSYDFSDSTSTTTTN